MGLCDVVHERLPRCVGCEARRYQRMAERGGGAIVAQRLRVRPERGLQGQGVTAADEGGGSWAWSARASITRRRLGVRVKLRYCTGMTGHAYCCLHASRRRRAAARVRGLPPPGRLASPDEIAAVALWLASEEPRRNVTGQASLRTAGLGIESRGSRA